MLLHCIIEYGVYVIHNLTWVSIVYWQDLIRTKVGKWSDRSENIIPDCTGILILLVYIWSRRVALWFIILVGLVISWVQL